MANVVTPEELLTAWNELFNEYPWLEGWEYDISSCKDIFCCPGNPPNWDAIWGAQTILSLYDAERHVTKISKNMIKIKEKHNRG